MLVVLAIIQRYNTFLMQERGRYNGLGYLYMQITTIEVPNKNETRVFIIHTYCPKQKKERFKEKKICIFIIKKYYMHKIIKNKNKNYFFYEFPSHYNALVKYYTYDFVILLKGSVSKFII